MALLLNPFQKFSQALAIILRTAILMRKIHLLIVGLFFIQSCVSQNKETIDWDADLSYISKELPKKHYDFFTVKEKDEYLTGIEKVRSNTESLTEFEIAIKLQQIVASFGDSHTKVNFRQFIDKNQILPLHLYWFSDGLYILHTTQENIEILGNKILSVNGTPIKTISDSLSSLITVDNQALIKSSIPKLFPFVQVLEYFGFAERQKFELELEDLAGNTNKHIIKPAVMNRENRKMFKPNSLALCYRNERALFIDYYKMDDRIYYLQYNKCWSKELENQYSNGKNADRLPSFKEFEDKVFKTLNNKPIDKLVFDLRFNGGGNSLQGTEFIDKISIYAEKNPDLRLFVILGRHTFSSAIINAMDFKKLTNVFFVGEETGGKPNHFGEVRNFRLPNSGLRVDYSTKYFKRTDENLKTLTPDIILETTFEDFINGIDPVYEWIKEQ